MLSDALEGQRSSREIGNPSDVCGHSIVAVAAGQDSWHVSILAEGTRAHSGPATRRDDVMAVLIRSPDATSPFAVKSRRTLRCSALTGDVASIVPAVTRHPQQPSRGSDAFVQAVMHRRPTRTMMHESADESSHDANRRSPQRLEDGVVLCCAAVQSFPSCPISARARPPLSCRTVAPPDAWLTSLRAFPLLGATCRLLALVQCRASCSCVVVLQQTNRSPIMALQLLEGRDRCELAIRRSANTAP